jgi:hypothetical protein
MLEWLSSFGLKRYLASLINVVIAVLRTVPGTYSVLIPWLEYAAAALGGVGIVHSTATKTLGGINATNISAVISVLLIIAKMIPQLGFLMPILEALAAIFGTVAISKGITGSISKTTK